jgi:NAD(P)-dependent dehydrogenase (short-subunit alcohol dehydrogenase family)
VTAAHKSEQRTALVTGGTRGIGLGAAKALAADGFNVVVSGRRALEEVTDVVTEVRRLASKHDADALYVQSDVADLVAHSALIDAAVDRFGSIDVLVNNAGVAPVERVDIIDATPESYDRVMSVNLRGPYFLTQAVARVMIRQTADGRAPREVPGVIINVTSISAVVASPNRGEYCMSKSGQAMSSLLWAVRLAEYGINVYDLRPGVIRTDMIEGVVEKYTKLIDDGLTVQKRIGEKEDVGRAVAMLARGDLAYSTGQVIYIDGGMLLHRL